MKKEANGEKILTRLTFGESEPSPAATPGESPRLVGVAAAIANAIYHATGVRVRTSPITRRRFLEARAG